jgi:Xaa-Pro aminopeptidase
MQVLPDSLVLIAAHKTLQQSADIAYPFRQDSSFWYFTGVQESGAVLAVDTKKGEAALLLSDQNDYQVEWEGEHSSRYNSSVFGITAVASLSSLADRIKRAKKQGLTVCYLAPLPEIVEPYGFYSNPARKDLEHIIKKIVDEPRDIRVEVARLRQTKQPVEITAIQDAIDVTGESLAAVKKKLTTYKNEKDIERALSSEFYARGADGHAFEPIVAAGKNAVTIHYRHNNADLQNNQLLLLDVGAQVDGYAADISRMWVLGSPTDQQRRVFDAVVKLQEEAFGLLCKGVHLKEYQKTMKQKAFKAAKTLGYELQTYPHAISHFLGLDVHDAGDYDAPLPVGSILTVEPGLYFAKDSVGVRIEDDVLITEDGIKVLSAKIPRDL